MVHIKNGFAPSADSLQVPAQLPFDLPFQPNPKAVLNHRGCVPSHSRLPRKSGCQFCNVDSPSEDVEIVSSCSLCAGPDTKSQTASVCYI